MPRWSGGIACALLALVLPGHKVEFVGNDGKETELR